MTISTSEFEKALAGERESLEILRAVLGARIRNHLKYLARSEGEAPEGTKLSAMADDISIRAVKSLPALPIHSLGELIRYTNVVTKNKWIDYLREKKGPVEPTDLEALSDYLILREYDGPPKVAVTSGKAEIVASGLVMAFQGNPISIEFGDPDPLSVVFEFRTIPESAESPKIQTYRPSPQRLVLTLINFSNPLGSGTTQPIKIGIMARDEIFLHFRAYSFSGSKDQTLQYCIFRVDISNSND